MELVTTHTHTDFVGHAQGSVKEMMDAAVAAGISVMAVTEHYPLSRQMDPKAYLSMPADRLDEYCQTVRAQAGEHPQLQVLLGTELDWLGKEEDRTFSPDQFDRFDIVLGSVHFVDGWAFDDPSLRGHWQEVGPDDIWKRYFEIWCEAADSDYPIDVMSHPDLVKKFGYRPSFDPSYLYSEAAEAAKAGGRMIELNTSGAYYDCHEVFPAPDLLKLFHDAGVPATIGTDAHCPANVGRDITQAAQTLYDAGYRHITVPTPDGDRRTIAID